MNNLINKKIVLGVTGGIAAYKSADLVRRLREAGAEVRVVMTAAAKAFITPLTMQALSTNPVHEDLFDPAAEAAMGHIALAKWADVILIAPASANVIAQLAYGFATDLLTTLCLATTAKIVIAPAMNQQMWRHKQTQENIQRLVAADVWLLPPASGEQACGDIGPGRLLEPTDIVAKLNEGMPFISQVVPKAAGASLVLAKQRVLITAGPTQEAIDPVRFMSNHSSGKMGFALAQAAVEAGAEVTLISGPTQLSVPASVNFISVMTALEMHEAVMRQVADCQIFIAAAAVADFRCAKIAKSKIKKSPQDLTLTLVKNPDIVAEVASRQPRPFVVGFAAETEQVLQYARKKLRDKKLDMIVANQVGEGKGFLAEENSVTIITPKKEYAIDYAPKIEIARQVIHHIANEFVKK